MQKNTKTALITLGVLGAAGAIAYFAVPPIIKSIEANTGRYNNPANQAKRFVTDDKLGRAMLTTGVIVITAGALTFGIQGLTYMVKHNNNLVTQFS